MKDELRLEGKDLLRYAHMSAEEIERGIDCLCYLMEELSEAADNDATPDAIFRERFQRARRAIGLLLTDMGDWTDNLKDDLIVEIDKEDCKTGEPPDLVP